MLPGRNAIVLIAAALGITFVAPHSSDALAGQIARVRALVRVPELRPNSNVGMAHDDLIGAGLRRGRILCDPMSGRPGALVGRVTAFVPATGTLVARGRTIDLRVIQARRCMSAIILPGPGPSPPPPPPPPVEQTCPDGSIILATAECPPPPPPPPPPPTPASANGHANGDDHLPTPAKSSDRPTAFPGPPPADSGPAETPAEEPTVPAPSATPSAAAEKGRGAFVSPGDMEVENWHRLEFVVGRTEAALAEESEDQQLTSSRNIYVAPTMQVSLLPDPNFQIHPQSAAIQETGADRAASWQWLVKPLEGGSHELIAQVEVLERQADGSLRSVETYKRRLPIKVRVGTWKGFLNALQGAASFGDLLGTLFRSWEKTLLALTALIAAAVGLWAAIRKLRTGPGS